MAVGPMASMSTLVDCSTCWIAVSFIVNFTWVHVGVDLMTKHIASRRSFLDLSVKLPLSLLLARTIFGSRSVADESVNGCADPTKLDSAQKGVRDTLHYGESSKDPAKACARCSFFEPSAGACGNCLILKGPVNAKGHCDSWNAKD
jgi:High potential iron-sulfur protein